jgi:GGDEF domain-containing protein
MRGRDQLDPEAGRIHGAPPPAPASGATALASALAAACGGVSPYATGRLQRVALTLGEAAGLARAELGMLATLCQLAALGALAVPAPALRAGSPEPRVWAPDESDLLAQIPSFGAEIARAVGLDEALACSLEAQCERWDGRGYPRGLRALEIPRMARIYAVARALTAFAHSDGEALELLERGAGAAYDPVLVRLVRDRSAVLRAARSAAPAEAVPAWAAAIAAARREERVLYEIAAHLGSSSRIEETLADFDERLQPLLGYDALLVADVLGDPPRPVYCGGADSAALLAADWPRASALCRRLTHSAGVPLLVEPGCARPALAGQPAAGQPELLGLRLEHGSQCHGILLLEQRRAFDAAAPRVLNLLREPLSAAVANANRHARLLALAQLDPVTGLPNARALFLRLDAELARCRRHATTLAVLACRLHYAAELGADERGALLPALAAALRGCFREEDYAASTGDGVTFVVDGISPADLAAKQERMEAGIRATFASAPDLDFGAAFFPLDGADAEALLAVAARRLAAASVHAANTPGGLEALRIALVAGAASRCPGRGAARHDGARP